MDFATSMRPDFHRAVIDTINHYAWKNIIYLYSSQDGKPCFYFVSSLQGSHLEFHTFKFVYKMKNEVKFHSFKIAVKQKVKFHELLIENCNTWSEILYPQKDWELKNIVKIRNGFSLFFSFHETFKEKGKLPTLVP